MYLCRLWRHGMSIHLIEGTPLPRPAAIDPLSDHVSFQAQASLDAVAASLYEMGIKYVRQEVVEGGIVVDQLFFHDPDCFMIEVCNCDSLPVCPLSAERGLPPAGAAGEEARHALHNNGNCDHGVSSSAASECTEGSEMNFSHG